MRPELHTFLYFYTILGADKEFEIQSGGTAKITTNNTYGEIWLVEARDKTATNYGVAVFILFNSRYSAHQYSYILCKDETTMTVTQANWGSVTITSDANDTIVVRCRKLMPAKGMTY